MPLKSWFGWQGVASTAVALVLSAACWLAQERALDDELEKVRFLKGEVVKLEREIAEVRSLRDEIAQVLARKQVVEVLQQDRLLTVQLFEQLARQRSAGVQLSAVREGEGRVFVAGTAASEADVAALLANLGASPLFERAQLVEVRGQRFSVSAALKGKRLPAARPLAARIPSDVHPGDPK